MQLHCTHGYGRVSCITESYIALSHAISSSGMHHHIIHMVQCSTVSHISQCMYRVHYVMAQYSTIQCSASSTPQMYSTVQYEHIVQHICITAHSTVWSVQYGYYVLQLRTASCTILYHMWWHTCMRAYMLYMCMHIHTHIHTHISPCIRRCLLLSAAPLR